MTEILYRISDEALCANESETTLLGSLECNVVQW
jgi:hypothetical protein